MPTTTLLFADQVGSTAQLGALGDQEVVPVRRALTDGMQEAVAAAGGQVLTVEGDGLFATFHSAVDGVTAAVAMQQAVALSNLGRPADHRVAIRIGLHTGEPVENERGDLYGLAVVVARRLCDEAGAGEILTSDLVRALVEPRRQHEFVALGRRTLKGIDDPVEAVAVSWSPDAPRLGLPADIPYVALPPGQRQLGAVGELWQAAVRGQARIVAAGGESARRQALTAGLAEQAVADGGLVFHARPTATSTTWDALLAGTRHYLDNAPPALVRMQTGRATGVLLGGAGAHHRRFVTAEPVAGEQGRAYFELLRAVSAANPLLVVVDDAHLASNEAVTVLNQAVAEGDGRHLLVVLLYDPAGLSSAPALRQVLGMGQQIGPMPPGPKPAGRPTVATPATPSVAPAPAGPGSGSPVSGVHALGLDITMQVVDAPPPSAALVLPDGRRVALDPGRVVIGRLPSSAVAVDDIDVSRRHALVRALGPTWLIEDLDSTNGTFVNEVAVRDQLLVDGDVIRVGGTRIRFELSPAPGSPPAADDPRPS